MALGVIPARLGSTRFPGKVLYPLAGKPMIRWVWERARRASSIEEVVIATDAEAVVEAARSFGASVVLTRADHESGTSRVAEVARERSHEIIVNIQGDEPLVDPMLLDRLVDALHTAAWADVATPAVPLSDDRRLADPNVVKLVMNHERRVLYFSRGPLPHGFAPRARVGLTWEHQGIYVFRRRVLEAYASLPASILEEAEKLEQLRLMEAGYAIVAVVAEEASFGVNTVDDIPAVEQLLRRQTL